MIRVCVRVGEGGGILAGEGVKYTTKKKKKINLAAFVLMVQVIQQV